MSMTIIEESIRRITISGVKGLDPIRVALEDIGPRQGRITIECYGQAWSSYWGGMGDCSIAEFFTSCDEHYLAKNLSSIKSQVFAPDLLKETLKRELIGERRKLWIDADEARRKFDAIEDLDLPEHEDGLWAISNTMEEIIGEEWWHSLPMKPNPDYEYLCRIIRAVQAGLSTEKTEVQP